MTEDWAETKIEMRGLKAEKTSGETMLKKNTQLLEVNKILTEKLVERNHAIEKLKGENLKLSQELACVENEKIYAIATYEEAALKRSNLFEAQISRLENEKECLMSKVQELNAELARKVALTAVAKNNEQVFLERNIKEVEQNFPKRCLEQTVDAGGRKKFASADDKSFVLPSTSYVGQSLNTFSKPSTSRDSEEHALITVTIPTAKVGLVIGKGGERIRSIIEKFSVEVIVEPNAADETETNLRIIGKTKNCEKARSSIVELIASETKLMVPKSAVGAIIGRNGDTLKKIKELTGARVNISSGQDKDNCNVCYICGSPKKREAAYVYITSIIKKAEFNSKGKPNEIVQGDDNTYDCAFGMTISKVKEETQEEVGVLEKEKKRVDKERKEKFDIAWIKKEKEEVLED